MILTVKDLQNKIKNDKAFRDQLLADFPEESNAALNQIIRDIIASDNVTDLNENLITVYLEAVDSMRTNAGTAGVSSRWAQYIRVPFGEDTFSINANTRVISVPATFKANGIAVSGDHLAEILYFDVDRFYDLTDLSLCDISIQWRNLGGKSSGNDTPRASSPFAMYATSEKVYFGWVVDENMTAFAGNIEFAVVFSMKDQDPTSSTYGQTSFILNTQAASVKVNAAIGFTATPSATPYETIIRNRPMYSHIVNTLNAAEPIIRLNLTAGDYNLDNGTEPKGWTVAAISPDGGISALSFVWEWNGLQLTPNALGKVSIDYPASSGTLISEADVTIKEANLYQYDFDEDTAGTAATFAALEELTVDNGAVYYVTADDAYYVFDGEAWIANPAIGRKSTIITNVPGRYDVLFGNRVTAATLTNGDPNPNYGGVRYVTSPSVTLIPAGPIEFDDSLLPDFAYYSTGTPILRAGYLEGDAIYDVRYEWYERNGESETLIAGIDGNFTPTKRGVYFCRVTNIKNNSQTTDDSKDVFIEMIPRVPDNRALVIDTINDETWDVTIKGIDHKIKCHINPPTENGTPLIASADATYKVMCSIQELNVTQPKFIAMDAGIQPSEFTLSFNDIWNQLTNGHDYEINILFTQATLNRLTGQYEYAKDDNGNPKYATQDHSQTWIKFTKEN